MRGSVLSVRGLGKAFRRYRHEFDRVATWFGARAKPVEENWVLKDVNFEVPAGQALGIVGRNGAGKSTLLKMVTGTTRPSEGSIHINGRIAAILELGMGFNYEMTGRQNAYQAAGMMGHNQADIDAVIAGIEEFSELGAYFEQPIRVYSSGMQVRLAFAVATAFRPDILIIDEALSVGDAYFQHKSFKRIREFRELGTTLILVSHDKIALQSICDRAILLEGGAIVRDGDPESVLDYYNALIAQKEGEVIETLEHPSGRIQTISGSRKAVITDVGLHDLSGKALDTVAVATPVELRVAVQAAVAIPKLVLGYAIKDRVGQTIYGTNTFFSDQVLTDLAPGDGATFSIRFPLNLGPGTYSIAVSLSADESHLAESFEWRDLALIFAVVNQGDPFDGKMFIPSQIEVRRMAAQPAGVVAPADAGVSG